METAWLFSEFLRIRLQGLFDAGAGANMIVRVLRHPHPALSQWRGLVYSDMAKAE